MIAIDLRVDDATSTLNPETGRRTIMLGGIDLREVDEDAITAIVTALRAVTGKRVRLMVLEVGEDFPEMPKSRKPHTGEGSDPFA